MSVTDHRLTLPLAGLSIMLCGPAIAADDKQALIEEALSAAPPTIADKVTVMDWEGNVLREGSGEVALTCHPTPPGLKGPAPMCMDEASMEWADAWANKKPFEAKQVGIMYMLAGDQGASNTDPFAGEATADNDWIVEGPHIMIVAPADAAKGLSTDPQAGGPYLMWEGTPYAHIMIPVGERPDQPEVAQR